ncbi:MAG: tetratricopeptide repeat protein [Nostoc sp.]|uniref:tetratricopeptide repeat protein n=1 Tax=Nostoc sp. TaxID=1180 RepID=UPI002FF147C5
MPRPSYGDDVKARVRQLLKRFLAYADYSLEDSQKFQFKDKPNWHSETEVIVRTSLRELAELGGLEKEQVREALKALADFLGVLKDERLHERGSEEWYFKLTLWCNKGDKEENLKKFDEEWQRCRREKLPGVQSAEARKAKLTPTPYENIPYSGVVEFVGRDTELQNLHRLLQENQQVAIAAIAGMGGVGKTELALQYANSHRVTYQGGICWLSALQDVGVQLVQFAINKLQLNIPDDLDLVGRVQHCLTKWHEGEVLLVIDNVTNYREEVRCYLESVPSRFKQLITTREKLQSPIVRLDLDVLTPLAAMQLLEFIITEERLRREQLVAEELCKRLGYLPLGLELVGRYLLGDEELSLAEMLQDLEKERLKNESLDEARPEMTAKLGVAAAFELSWRRLRENAQLLGCLLSLFALAPIPWKLVEDIRIANEAQDCKKARRDLLQLNLLQYKGERIYQLHPLLREFFQYKLTGLEQAKELKRSLCRKIVAVAKGIPYPATLEQITDVTPDIPHIAEVANHLIQYVSDDDFTWPFISNALFYRSQGLYNQAIPWSEQCLEITKKRFGEEHPDVANRLNDIASLYKYQGRYDEAERYYIEALALLRHQLREKEHPFVVSILNNLASLYRYQGRYNEAETLLLEALALSPQLVEEEYSSIAPILKEILYKSQARYSAKPSDQEMVLVLKQMEQEYLSHIAKLNTLGLVYDDQRRYREAETLYQKASSILDQLVGEEHPYVATTLNNLAVNYRFQGRYKEAEPFYIKALALRRKLLGKEHPDVAQSLNNLAGFYLFKGRYREAEPLYIEALNIFERCLGANHPNTVTVREDLTYLTYLRDRLPQNPE